MCGSPPPLVFAEVVTTYVFTRPSSRYCFSVASSKATVSCSTMLLLDTVNNLTDRALLTPERFLISRYYRHCDRNIAFDA